MAPVYVLDAVITASVLNVCVGVRAVSRDYIKSSILDWIDGRWWMGGLSNINAFYGVCDHVTLIFIVFVASIFF